MQCSRNHFEHHHPLTHITQLTHHRNSHITQLTHHPTHTSHNSHITQLTHYTTHTSPNSHITQPTQEAGILLSKPWPEEGEVTGKAISLLCRQMLLGQFLVATTMGFLISLSGTHRVTLLVSFGGSFLAMVTSLRLTVPSKHTSSSSLLPC